MIRRNTWLVGAGIFLALLAILYTVVTIHAFDEHTYYDVSSDLLPLFVTLFFLSVASTFLLGMGIGRTSKWRLKIGIGVFLFLFAGVLAWAAMDLASMAGLSTWETILRYYAGLLFFYACVGGFSLGLGMRKKEMANTEMEKAIGKQLAAGERILAIYGPFCATDKRVIKHELRGVKFGELPYSSIESVDMDRHARTSELWIGIVLCLIGFWGLTTIHPVGMIHFILFLVLGIALVVVAARFKVHYYRFRAPATVGLDEAAWRTEINAGSEHLIHVIKEQLPEHREKA